MCSNLKITIGSGNTVFGIVPLPAQSLNFIICGIQSYLKLQSPRLFLGKLCTQSLNLAEGSPIFLFPYGKSGLEFRPRLHSSLKIATGGGNPVFGVILRPAQRLNLIICGIQPGLKLQGPRLFLGKPCTQCLNLAEGSPILLFPYGKSGLECRPRLRSSLKIATGGGNPVFGVILRPAKRRHLVSGDVQFGFQLRNRTGCLVTLHDRPVQGRLTACQIRFQVRLRGQCGLPLGPDLRQLLHCPLEFLTQRGQRCLQFNPRLFGRSKQSQRFLCFPALCRKIQIHRNQVIGGLIRPGQKQLVLLPDTLQFLQCGGLETLCIKVLLNQRRNPFLQTGNLGFKCENGRPARIALPCRGPKSLLQCRDVLKRLEARRFGRVRTRGFTCQSFRCALKACQQVHNPPRFAIPFAFCLPERQLQRLNVCEVALLLFLCVRYLLHKLCRLSICQCQQCGHPVPVRLNQPVGLTRFFKFDCKFGPLGHQLLKLIHRLGK